MKISDYKLSTLGRLVERLSQETVPESYWFIKPRVKGLIALPGKYYPSLSGILVQGDTAVFLDATLSKKKGDPTGVVDQLGSLLAVAERENSPVTLYGRLYRALHTQRQPTFNIDRAEYRGLGISLRIFED